VAVDATGQLKIVGGGGGGGGSTDMTVANAQLIAINANTDGLEGKADTGNALLTTQAADTALIKDEVIAIDAKLPSLSSGRIPVESNNAASQVLNYTATGAVANGTILVPSTECSLLREVSVHLVASGAGFFFRLEISNDNANWISCPATTSSGTVSIAQFGTAGVIYNYNLLGARFFRITQAATQTAGTTTLVAYASQQATPKLYQSVAVTGTVSAQPSISNNIGFTTYHTLVSAASTNATSVKTSSANIGTLILTNTSATWAYFKLINKSSSPTVGTDTAIINIGVAPNTTLDCSTAFAGLRMSTGLAYYVSAGTSLTDNTALPAAGTFLVNMTYV
jgi:hypothetical protein